MCVSFVQEIVSNAALQKVVVPQIFHGLTSSEIHSSCPFSALLVHISSTLSVEVNKNKDPNHFCA